MRHLISCWAGVLCVTGIIVSCGPLEEGELVELPPPAPVEVAAPEAAAPSSLLVQNVNAPDGTRVRYMLGLIGCGIMELGAGETVVQNGRFEVKFQPSDLTRDVDLFYRLDQSGEFTCGDSDDVTRVPGVSPEMTVVDASRGNRSHVGCWLFSRTPSSAE